MSYRLNKPYSPQPIPDATRKRPLRRLMLGQRFLDGLPGLVVWTSLLAVLIGAIFAPRTTVLVAASLALYVSARFVLIVIGNAIGTRRIREWERRDWHVYYQREAEKRGDDVLPLEAVQHVLVIPNHKEPEHVLRDTLERLADHTIARQQITVVLAMEAGEPGSAEKAERFCEQYRDRFAHIFYTVHPRGLPGEVPGKSSNEAWAGRQAKLKMVDELGYDIDQIVVSSMDADTRWHPQHFLALSCRFALNPQRYTTLWQAPIRYHGNVWQINPLWRLLHTYAASIEQAYMALPGWIPLPMSSYALSMRLLDTIDYWDGHVIAEDWHMYLKIYVKSGGKLRIDPLYLPFHAHAITGATFWETARNRYEQTRRHAWGSQEVGYLMASMARHHLPAWRSLRVLTRTSHDVFMAGAGWIIMTLGIYIPLILHPEVILEFFRAGFNSPQIVLVTIAFNLIFLMSIALWWQDVRLRPPRAQPSTGRERALVLLSFPLLAVMTVVLLAFPAIHAQTQLLLGANLQYRVAQKA